MAIKITKPGQKEFHGFCKWCGCEFTYEISDLKLSATSDKVSCPTCGKDYHHPAMVQNPTIPGGIGYQWPSDSTDPCAGCTWLENLKQNDIYIGDTPCTWCNKGRFNVITGKEPSISDYTTPCISQLDSYLSSSTGTTYTLHNCCNKSDADVVASAQQKVYDTTGCSKELTQGSSDNVVLGTVMNTILECCHSCTKDLNKCGDTESNYCSTDSNCGNTKNCKGKH